MVKEWGGIPVTTRTVEVHGVILPWAQLARYGPPTDKVEKGETIASGEVFVSFNEMWPIAERTAEEGMFDLAPPPPIGYHAGLAMEQAGLAVSETRGGYHGTEKLHQLLNTLEA